MLRQLPGFRSHCRLVEAQAATRHRWCCTAPITVHRHRSAVYRCHAERRVPRRHGYTGFAHVIATVRQACALQHTGAATVRPRLFRRSFKLQGRTGALSRRLERARVAALIALTSAPGPGSPRPHRKPRPGLTPATSAPGLCTAHCRDPPSPLVGAADSELAAAAPPTSRSAHKPSGARARVSACMWRRSAGPSPSRERQSDGGRKHTR
jgi:hypothetical protein